MSKGIVAKLLVSFKVTVLRRAQHERFWRLIEVFSIDTAILMRLSSQKWLKTRMDIADSRAATAWRQRLNTASLATLLSMQSFWMILAAALFAVMALVAKLLSTAIPTGQMVFFRGVVAAIALYAFVLATRRSVATPHIRLHAQRSVSGVAALVLYFYAIAALPLGTATTLNYTAPLFVAMFVALAGWQARRPAQTKTSAVCIGAGFAGIALLLKPVFSAGDTVPALLGLLSGLLSAVAYWNIRSLGKLGEPEWRVVLFHSILASLAGLAGMAWFGAVWPTAVQWLMLISVGLLALVAQLALTRAFSHGKTLLTSSLQYLTIVFASILGVLFASDPLDAQALTGMAIVVASCVLSTVLTLRASPPAMKETLNVSNVD
jgi:drug/metabolite transporter (DMT)-like permease